MKKNLVIIAVALALSGCMELGDGEKLGVITRASTTGWFCKTNEIEIVRGGMNNGTGVVGSAFHATVENPALFDRLKKALENQEEVKIHFKHEWISFCRSDSGSNFVTAVESVTPVGVNRPAPTAVTGSLQVAPVPSVPSNETREQKVNRLLATQAELLKELAVQQ